MKHPSLHHRCAGLTVAALDPSWCVADDAADPRVLAGSTRSTTMMVVGTVQHVGAAPLDHRKRTTRARHRGAVTCDLFVGAFALERDEPAALPKQGSAPRPQSSKRSDRPRDDYIGTRELLLDGRLFRAAPNHTCGQRKSIDDFGQPRHPTSHWLQKCDVQIRSGDSRAALRAVRRPNRGRPRGRPRGIASATTAEFRRCRSQRRSTSRGPIKPRSTPTAASSSANRIAAGRASPKIAAAVSGGGDADGVSANPEAPLLVALFHVKQGTVTTGGTPRRDVVGPRPRSRCARRRPSATASWTTLRSNGVIGWSRIFSPSASTRSAVARPRSVSSCATVRAPPGDVQHEPATRAGLLLHREPGQLLQRLEHVAPRADELLQIVAAVDAHHRTAGLDVQVDVAVVVDEVEQPLQVVPGDVALADQQLLAGDAVLGFAVRTVPVGGLLLGVGASLGSRPRRHPTPAPSPARLLLSRSGSAASAVLPACVLLAGTVCAQTGNCGAVRRSRRCRCAVAASCRLRSVGAGRLGRVGRRLRAGLAAWSAVPAVLAVPAALAFGAGFASGAAWHPAPAWSASSPGPAWHPASARGCCASRRPRPSSPLPRGRSCLYTSRCCIRVQLLFASQ